MKTQHTPGPWHIEQHTKPVWQDSGGPGNVAYAQMVPITLIVHEQLGDPRLRTCVCQLDASTEAEGNANLIAAAPELAEALRLCYRRLAGKAPTTGLDEGAMEAARAILAKIEGREG